MSAERVREGRKGSDEEVGAAVVVDDGPAVNVGSSKSNVSGFGAGVGCSDGEALTTRLLILPSQHRLTGSFATGCELRVMKGDLRRIPDEDLVPFGLSAGDADLV